MELVSAHRHSDQLYSTFPQLLNIAFSLSRGLLEKLCQCNFRFKHELDRISNEQLKERFGFSEEHINEINCRIRQQPEYTEFTIMQWQKDVVHISTGCSGLDFALGGEGLRTGMLTQVSGEAGSGKSQICMQLCFRVQLNSMKGGDALYLDTEDSFRPERIYEMAINHFRRTITDEKLLQFKANEVLTRIHLRKVNTNVDNLLDIILNGELENFFDYNTNIRLLVLDSIAYHFRYDYGYSFDARLRQLIQIIAKFKHFARHRNIAVFITNQVRLNNIPALGTTWNSLFSTSLLLSRSTVENGCGGDGPVRQEPLTVRQCSLLKSPDVPRHCKFHYCITPNGVEDLPTSSPV